VKQRTALYPRPRVDVGGAGVVSQAGGVLLTAAIGRVGLDQALSAALAPWRKPHAVHDAAKVVLDLAVRLALGDVGPELCPQYTIEVRHSTDTFRRDRPLLAVVLGADRRRQPDVVDNPLGPWDACRCSGCGNSRPRQADPSPVAVEGVRLCTAPRPALSDRQRGRAG
jgi:hypothetical protein